MCSDARGILFFKTFVISLLLLFLDDMRDIRKVRKRQHQYPQFGHTQGDILKNCEKKYISIQGEGETQKTMVF